MPDPNVQAAKGIHTGQEEANACADMGLVALVQASKHPGIVSRWNMEHLIAPGKLVQKTATDRAWRNYIWVNAWVYVLFNMHAALDLFSNAWTSVQENKPRIVALKAAYDKANGSLEEQLMLLTAFDLGWTVLDERVQRGVSAAIMNTQRRLDEAAAR